MDMDAHDRHCLTRLNGVDWQCCCRQLQMARQEERSASAIRVQMVPATASFHDAPLVSLDKAVAAARGDQ